MIFQNILTKFVISRKKIKENMMASPFFARPEESLS